MASNFFKNFFKGLWETIEVVAIAGISVYLIRSYLVQPFLVSGASMYPNFADGNYLLVDELTYRLRDPERGEVIVFKYPEDPSLFFIKRIIGLPNERIVSSSGVIKIESNGREIKLDEGYIKNKTNDNFDVLLGENEYFVLGDNRPRSYDSRSWGAIKRTEIVGLVKIRVLPIKDLTIFQAPKY